MTRRRIFNKTPDPLDQWLESQGLYRKHVARDGSCLFRAVSEQVMLTQAFHKEVRKHCTEHILRHKAEFAKLVEGSVEEYVTKMRRPCEPGGHIELLSLAAFYRHDILVFQHIGKPPFALTDHGFNKKIVVCVSSENHYDSVYMNSYISDAGLCQSLVYGLLYSNVFMLDEVCFAVDMMLRKSTNAKKNNRESLNVAGENCFSSLANMSANIDFVESKNMKHFLACGIVPFPYKVAKALDASIYRNIEFDVWSDMKRDQKYGFLQENELREGVKCLVKMDMEEAMHGYIQHMESDDGPVIIYVEELGKMCTVEYKQLECLPKSERPQWPLPLRRCRSRHVLPKVELGAEFDLGPKLRRSRLNRSRRVKEDCSTQMSNTGRNRTSAVQQCGVRIMVDEPLNRSQVNMQEYSPNNFAIPSSSKNFQAAFSTTAVAPSATCSSSISSEVPFFNQQSLHTEDFNKQRPSVQSQIVVRITPSPVIYQERDENKATPPPLPDSTTSPIIPDGPAEVFSPSAAPTLTSCASTGNQFYIPQQQITNMRSDHLYPVYMNPCSQSVDVVPQCDSSNNGSPVASGEPGGITVNGSFHPINAMAQKSFLADGSDLPLTDIQTLRFYYNLGCDWFHQTFLQQSINVDNYLLGGTSPLSASDQNEVNSTVTCNWKQCSSGQAQRTTVQKSTDEQSNGTSTGEPLCESTTVTNEAPNGSAIRNQAYMPTYNNTYLPYYSVGSDTPVFTLPLSYYPYTASPNLPLIVQPDTDNRSDGQTQPPSSSMQVPVENSCYQSCMYYNMGTPPFVVHPGPVYQHTGMLPPNASKWNTTVPPQIFTHV